MLEPLFKDRNEEHGLKTDWREVEGTVYLLTKLKDNDGAIRVL